MPVIKKSVIDYIDVETPNAHIFQFHTSGAETTNLLEGACLSQTVVIVPFLHMSELWGGAVTAVLPKNVVNAADFREIPDNQEVFVHVWSSINAAFIVELNEEVKSSSLIESLAIHVAEVGRMAGDDVPDPMATWTEKIGEYETANLVNSMEPTVLRPGERGRDRGHTYNFFTLFCLKEFETDVLVCSTYEFNDNQEIEDGAPTSVDEISNSASAVIRDFVRTFTVKDGSLFNHNHR